ncbi:MAG: Rid family hydrolase, partial [Flavobacteriales bacterium]
MKNCLYFIITLALVWVTPLKAQEESSIKFHASHEEKIQSAPYSDAVSVGNLFFLTGQIGMDQSSRTMVTGGIKAETEQTIKNIAAVLEHHGMGLDRVVKCTVIL